MHLSYFCPFFLLKAGTLCLLTPNNDLNDLLTHTSAILHAGTVSHAGRAAAGGRSKELRTEKVPGLRCGRRSPPHLLTEGLTSAQEGVRDGEGRRKADHCTSRSVPSTKLESTLARLGNFSNNTNKAGNTLENYCLGTFFFCSAVTSDPLHQLGRGATFHTSAKLT